MAIFVSASLLEDFLSCNRKVHYRLEKSESAIQSREMIIGEVVHKALELFWNNYEGAIGHCTAHLQERLPGDIAALPTAFSNLDNYFRNFYPLLFPNDRVEARFKIKLSDDIYVVGKMDRVTENGAIFDWKTTANPPKYVSGSVQLALYSWAYRQLYHKFPAGVYFAYLSTGKLMKYDHDSTAESSLLNDLIPDLVATIRRKEFIRNGIFKRTCHGCAYSETCLGRS